MPSLRRKSQFTLAGCLVAVASFSAQAEIVLHQGMQAPKPNLNLPAPPDLLSSIQTAQALFSPAAAPVASLGGTEFELNPGANNGAPNAFSYGVNGTASFSGGAKVIDGGLATPDNGRYNMTPGLSANNWGHWIEATTSFTMSFTEAFSAFSFFVTDLGDFDGQVTLELYADEAAGGNNAAPLFSSQLVNNAGVSSTDSNGRRVGGNGNLLWAGVTSSTDGVSFKSARFVLTQCTPNLNDPNDTCNPTVSPDVIGFDSFAVGTYRAPPTGGTIPEPTSLALVGLGLLAAGWSRKAQRTA